MISKSGIGGTCWFLRSCLPEVGEDETSLFTTASSAVYSERIFPLYSTILSLMSPKKRIGKASG